MALVFVHGVNVRYDPDNDPYVKARDAFFRHSVLAASVGDPSASMTKNPYWGAAGAKFPWKHGGLPEGRYEQFGGTETSASGLINDLALTGLLDPNQDMAGLDPDKLLLTLARTSFCDAVDRLWVVGARDLDENLGHSYVHLSLAIANYVAANPRPTWIDSVRNDQEFISELLRVADKQTNTEKGASLESFGMNEVKEAVRTAAANILDSFVEILSEARQAVVNVKSGARHWLDDVVLRVRAPAHASVATFLGDAFV
jgi:hypothetical protein